MTDWITERNEKAASIVKAALAKPAPKSEDDLGTDFFDPWEDIFEHPQLYGNYSAEFDICAVDILEELLAHEFKRNDLGAYMFREILCRNSLCDYGTSPRTCFVTTEFERVLPELIAKWKDYSKAHWTLDIATMKEMK